MESDEITDDDRPTDALTHRSWRACAPPPRTASSRSPCSTSKASIPLCLLMKKQGGGGGSWRWR
jgi:hypothetical protein